VAKFRGDRPRDRGDLALNKKKKERKKQQQNIRAAHALRRTALIKQSKIKYGVCSENSLNYLCILATPQAIVITDMVHASRVSTTYATARVACIHQISVPVEPCLEYGRRFCSITLSIRPSRTRSRGPGVSQCRYDDANRLLASRR